MLTKITIGVLALTMVAGVSLGGAASQYRGPEGSNPFALAPPSLTGPIGMDRLGSKSREIEGESRWEFWWEMNRDRYLRLAANRTAGPVSSMASMKAPGGRGPEWVGEADVRVRIVNALLERLASRDEEERARAAIALGRTRVSAAFGPLKKLLDEGTHSDRRAAALGIGLLGEPLGAAELARFAGRAGVSPSDRAFAALGLGLLRDPAGVPALTRLLKESLSHRGRSIADFQASAVTALGLIGETSSASLLERIARTRNGIDDDVRAAAFVALGRINAEGVVKVLSRGLDDGDVAVRRAAAGALGLTGRFDAQNALLTAYRKDSDVSVRSFAAVSMARIGGPNVGNALLGGLHRSNPRALRGFVAIGLGILGDRKFAPALRELVIARDEKSLAAAAAVGLGIMGDRGAAPFLRSVARDEKKGSDLRGYSLLSLSMLGDRTTLLSLSGTLADSGDLDVRRAAGMSLGLAGAMKKGPALLKALFRDSDARVRGATINSLALTPRRSVLGTLIDVATASGYPRDMRIDAVTALGVLAARGRPSAFEAAFDGINYRSLSPSLTATVRQF